MLPTANIFTNCTSSKDFYTTAKKNSIHKVTVALFLIFYMHCIFFRGENTDDTHKTASRKWFSYIGELRSICPSATLLVLSVRSLEGTEFEIIRHKRNTVTVTKQTKHRVKIFKSFY